MKFVVAALVTAALSGCSTFQPPSDPAIPSAKGARTPINRPAADEISRGRNSQHEAQTEQRVRRVAAQESGAESAQEDFSLQIRYPLTTRYVYGTSTPVIVCAVSHVCDIELQAGEKIIPPLRTGDRARWQLDVATAGQGSSEVPHLTVMPLEMGIETSLMVITTKRTYHMLLRASRSESMLRTVFMYPDDMAARWTAAETPPVSVK